MLKWAILNAVSSIFKLAEFLILANAIASWFPMFTQNPTVAKIVYMINTLTEPILKPVRKLMEKTPLGGMPIDISPIIAIVLLSLLQNVVVIVIAAI